MSACSLKYPRRASTVLAYRPSRGDSAASGEGMGLYYKGDEGDAFPGDEGGEGLPDLHALFTGRSKTDLSCQQKRSPADRRPGAGAPRAPDRNPLERCVGRRAAGVARARAGSVLRRLARGDRPGRPLLSRDRQRRRPAAAARVRAALAAAVSRFFAFHRNNSTGRKLCPVVLLERQSEEN